MSEINMDTRNNKDATVPILEFKIGKEEVQADLKVGERGTLCVDVEVVANSDDFYTFRKVNVVRTDSTFRPETSADMEKRAMEQEDDED